MKVLLDTDTASYIFGRRDEGVSGRFLAYVPGDVAISSITAAELVYGAELNPSERNRVAVERALASLVIAPFDTPAARAFGSVRAALQRRGTPIGHIDLLIAAHALSLDIPLVTNNVREFNRVRGLRVENWLA